MSKISFFKNVYNDKNPTETSIDEFITYTEEGRFKTQVEKCREGLGEESKQLKSKLPAYTISGYFEGGHHLDNLVTPSGLICIDFDPDKNKDFMYGLEEIKEILSEDKHSYVVCLSCRGQGLMVVCKYNTADNFGCVFDSLKDYYYNNFGIIADASCRDITRLRYVTYDEDIRVNDSASTFTDVKKVERKESIQKQESKGVITPMRQSEIRKALANISPNEYDTWFKIGCAIHNEEPSSIGFELFRDWSYQNDTEEKYDESACINKWNSFGNYSGDRITIDTLFRISKDNTPSLLEDIPTESSRRLKVLTGDQINVMDVPEPKWIIEGLLQEARQGVLIAPPKHFKSFIVQQMGMCASSGTSFLDYKVPERDNRNVFLINLEVHEDDICKRNQRMSEALSIPTDDLKSLHVFSARCAKSEDNFFIEDPAQLVSEIQRYQDEKNITPSLIIIDCLYKIFRGNENDGEEMGHALELINKWCASTGACVLTVHHDAKGSSADRDMMDRGSGSGKLTRNVDFIITLTAQAGEEGHVILDAGLRNSKYEEGTVVKFTGTHLVATDLYPEPNTNHAKAEAVRKKSKDSKIRRRQDEILEMIDGKILSLSVLHDSAKALNSDFDANSSRFKEKYIQPLVDDCKLVMFPSRHFGTGKPHCIVTDRVLDEEVIEKGIMEHIEEGDSLSTAVTKVSQKLKAG